MTRDELRERLAMALAGLVVVKAPVTEMVDALFLGLQAAGMAVVPQRPDEKLIEIGRNATFDGMRAAYRAMLAAGDLLGGKDG